MTYATLDDQILEAVRLGARDFAAISSRCAAERDRLARLLGTPPDLAFRLVDRRLQALKRRGLIEHRGGGWRVPRITESNPS
jgi:hypothetical protein